MKRLLVSFIVLFTLIFSYSILAQQYGRARSGIEISIPVKLQKAVLDPLPAGTYTIGAGGYFATITDAFNKLSIDGIGGEVTLELIDTLYVAPTDSFGFKLVGPIPGAGPNSRVILKPAANKNVVLQGNGRYVIYFFNTSYLNFDGVSTDGETTLTIYSIYNSLFDLNRATRFSANSDHNIIQNLTCIGEDLYRYGDLIVFGAVDNSSAPDSNLIQNNFIKKGGGSIVIGGFSSSRRAMGNIVRNNKIGSQTDSLISWGIQLENCQNTIVENNIVQNMKVTTNVGDIFIPGINSLWGNGDIIRNNTVYNINTSKGYSSVGILLSGLSGEFGNNNQVYNNVVYDINSTSTQYDSRVTGIQMWYQNNPKIYYNSVYLSGTGANKYGSAALYISLACYNVDVKNNIFVNTRDESPYCASAIYGVSSGILTDYNNLYYEPNQNNCLVRIGSTDYNTLAEWRMMGKDLFSVSEMPNFTGSDLHIDSGYLTNTESRATPIAGVDTDFDGDARDSQHPDIGADEFEGQTRIFSQESWTKHGSPVLLSGSAGEWDDDGLGMPCVIYDGTTYKIWYCGFDGASWRIGYATSPDGINWTKYNDPSTTNPPYAESDPVLNLGPGGWDLVWVYAPFVHFDGTTYRMWYAGTDGYHDRVGYATSPDGITWTKNPANPVINLGPSGSWDDASVDPGPIIFDGTTFHMLYNGFDGLHYQGGYATSTDGINWTKSTDPVITFGSVGSWDNPRVQPNSLVYNDSTSKYFLFYSGGGFLDWRIGYATAPALNGPWTKDPSIMLDVTLGGFDSDVVGFPCVIEDPVSNLYKTWYLGGSSSSVGAIGYATTPNWPLLVEEEKFDEVPTEFVLSQNYPNPFNPNTKFRYSITNASKVTIKIYDVLGKEIETLINEEKPTGTYELTWNASKLPSGVYFYRLQAGSFVQTRKMILLK